MQCRVYRPVDRDVVQVWFYEDRDDGRRCYARDEATGFFRTEVVQEGEPMPVSLEWRPEFFEALVKAGSDFLPPSSAMARHLDDAIGVRDRLLTLVEQS